jgi:hypothetical protein
MLLNLITSLFNIGEKVIDKVVPNKLDEKEKEELKIKFKLLMFEEMKLNMEKDKNFRQFMLDYEGKLSDIPKPIQYIRSSVRPVLTYAISGAYIYGWLHPEIFTEEQMLVLKPAILMVLGFWFGEKLITRTGLADVLTKKK